MIDFQLSNLVEMIIDLEVCVFGEYHCFVGTELGHLTHRNIVSITIYMILFVIGFYLHEIPFIMGLPLLTFVHVKVI
jgi:hypothetical protein